MQFIPYVRSSVQRQDLNPGTPIRSPFLDCDGDLHVKEASRNTLSFRETDRTAVIPGNGPIRFALRDREHFQGTVKHEEPVEVKDLTAFDFLLYMTADTRVHTIARIPGTTICRVSIHDQPRRKWHVTYLHTYDIASYPNLLNGTVSPWRVPILTAMNYRNKTTGESTPLLVHPLGRGLWHPQCVEVLGAYATPKIREGWDRLEFTGKYWTERHPSDPARRPKVW